MAIKIPSIFKNTKTFFGKLIFGDNANKLTLQYTANVARTVTIPDPGANADVVMGEGAQTIAGVKTFSNGINWGDGTITAVKSRTETKTLGDTTITGTVTLFTFSGLTVGKFYEVRTRGKANRTSTSAGAGTITVDIYHNSVAYNEMIVPTHRDSTYSIEQVYYTEYFFTAAATTVTVRARVTTGASHRVQDGLATIIEHNILSSTTAF